VSVVRNEFTGVANNAVAGLGFSPEIPAMIFPVNLFLVESDLTPVTERIDEFVTVLTKWEPAVNQKGVMTPSRISIEGKDYEEALTGVSQLFLQSMWGDGLPLLPPTKERVDWILTGTDLPHDQVIGKILPKGGIASVETIAVSLAMAGGRPEYLPVLIAVVEAIVDPELRHDKWQASSGSRFPVVLVNGPIANQIRLNSGFGLLGPDSLHPSGGAIGRALRLLQQNVGGATPGVGTMSQFSGMRYTNAVFGEDEAGLPPGWEPFNVDYLGYPKGTNTVAVFTADGVQDVFRRGPGLGETLEEEALSGLYRTAVYMHSPDIRGDEIAGMLIINSIPANQMAELGWTQQSIKEFLWENTKSSWSEVEKSWVAPAIEQQLEELGIPRGEPWPQTNKPENILIAVAGGKHPTHSYWIAGNWAYKVGRAEIGLPANWDELLKQAEEDLGPAPPD
jgi:hypothetical protein